MKFIDINYTKRLFTLALPIMLTQLGQVSVNIFDNIIVGKLIGADALASVSLANGVFFSIFVLAIGFSMAIPPLVSQAHTQKNHQKINKIFRHGFVLNLTIGFILIAFIFGTMPLLYHLNQPEKILPDTEKYLTINTISIIPLMIFQTMRTLSEGLGFTIGVTRATIIANIVNIVLDYIFIKGLFGIPSMGVEGSAYATLISRVLMIIFIYFSLKNHSLTKQYLIAFTLNKKLFSKKQFSELFRIGFPTALQMFFEVTAFAAAGFICGLVSVTDIAAHQVTLSLASLTFNLCIGFSVATTVMIGNRLGEKDYQGLKETGINNIKIVFLFMLMCSIIFIVGRNVLPTIFTKPEDIAVIQMASTLMIAAALFQLSDGIQIAVLGILRGIQDVKIPSVYTFIAYWLITLPLSYMLCYVMDYGAIGVWASLGIGLTISCILLVARFLKLSQKLIHQSK